MDGFVLSSVQGAVDSLLGRLATVLTDEAQLLRGVRGDMLFIRDEMDSMNGLLLHVAALADTGHGHGGHHHVRAWMRQFRDLANNSQGCVNRYIRHLSAGHRRRGPLGYVHRAHHLLWTIRARRRITNKEIQELKVQAREVGERRKRYGINVPLAAGDQERVGSHKPLVPLPHAVDGQDDAWRLAQEDRQGPVVSGKDVRKLTKWLTEDTYDNGQLKVIPIVGPSDMGKSALAWQ